MVHPRHRIKFTYEEVTSGIGFSYAYGRADGGRNLFEALNVVKMIMSNEDSLDVRLLGSLY